jgi:phage baseplate assembly protein W
MARADRYTFLNKQLVYYDDVKYTFTVNKNSGNLSEVTNEEAVKQSLYSLIFTTMGEAPYQPYKGSKIKSNLFDPVDPTNTSLIKSSIEATCKLEPRARIIEVEVQPSPDEQQYFVAIAFTIVNIPNQTFTLEHILKRIR